MVLKKFIRLPRWLRRGVMESRPRPRSHGLSHGSPGGSMGEQGVINHAPTPMSTLFFQHHHHALLPDLSRPYPALSLYPYFCL